MPKNALHLDDDPDWRDWVGHYLTHNGVTVVSVQHVQEAAAELTIRHFDVVICDAYVDVRPKDHSQGDGVVFAEMLAQQGRRVIVLSNVQTTSAVPYLDKCDWLDGAREKLYAFING